MSNIILICIFHMGAEGMIISMALANGLCSLYLFIKLKLYKNIDFKLVDKKLIKDMYKYSLPLVPNGISWWIVNISDRTIISFVLELIMSLTIYGSYNFPPFIILENECICYNYSEVII